MLNITVEYRADLENRKTACTFSIGNSSISLAPGFNQISSESLQKLESIEYFNVGVENRIFIVTKPIEALSTPSTSVNETTVLGNKTPVVDNKTTVNDDDEEE